MQTKMTGIELLKLLKEITDALIEAVRAAGPLGAPGGTLYAGLMQSGCNIAQFEAIMGALVTAKKLRKSGQIYFVVEAAPAPGKTAPGNA